MRFFIILLTTIIYAGGTKMQNQDVLISGGGVAGLTTAYFLEQAGYRPTIVEKHHELRASGYKIDIRGTALEVVKKMGIHDAIAANATEMLGSKQYSAGGKLIAETDGDLSGVRMDGDLEIVRGDLLQIMVKNLKKTEIIFSEAITKIDGKTVHFENSPPRQFDLIVGADGLHSKTRKLVWNDEENVFHNMGSFISFFSIPNYLKLDRIELEYQADGKFAIAYCPKDGMAKAGFAFAAEKPEGNIRDESVQKQFIRQIFADDSWEIPRLLDLMDKCTDLYFDCMAQIRMPHFTHENVALVGDAGYCASPMSGQGTSLALIGAYILVDELKKAEGNHATAFPRYEERIKPFIERNQEVAKKSAELLSTDEQGIAEMFPNQTMEEIMQYRQKYMAEVANSIML